MIQTTQKYMMLTAISLAAVSPALAQKNPNLQIPEAARDAIVKELPRANLKLKTGEERARAAGCVKSQTYNTQNVNRYSTAFTVATSSGDKTFNFERDEIRFIPPGAGLPLPSRAETLQWEHLIDTIQLAASTRTQLLVDYTTPSNEVFGIFVLWASKCVD